ncbi:MAG: transporter substrate-binding domain-containing protein [Actinomycetota bacterium]
MRRGRWIWLVALFAALTLVAAACGGDDDDPGTTDSTETSGGEADDLLAKVKADGVLRVSTDPQYPPQSSYDEATGQWEGFDIDAATEIANRLGVEIEWKTPSWNVLTSGNWQDRWDLSVGSMTVTPERAEVLNFSEPYYYTPAAVAVHEDSSVASVEELSGMKIGVCQACTYDVWLQGKLVIPGEDITFPVENPQIVTYSTDSLAIKDLELGDGVRLDAASSALPTIQGAIDQGAPIKVLGEPVFYEPLAAATDKGSSLDTTSFDEEVSSIIAEMHSDGTLSELSDKWYGEDLTKKVDS